MSIEAILTGQTETHLSAYRDGVSMHKETLPDFLSLQAEGRKHGFEIEVVSAFRSFDAQMRIWNLKATGKRPLLDTTGKTLDFASLSPESVIHAILRWSALPGASRHHWGSDVDVIDLNALPEGYQVQLTPAEVTGNGPFAKMHDWLDGELQRFGFFRPYAEDRGGVSPERWHLSHTPVAAHLFSSHKVEILESTLQHAQMELKDTVLRILPTLFTKYFRNIST